MELVEPGGLHVSRKEHIIYFLLAKSEQNVQIQNDKPKGQVL